MTADNPIPIFYLCPIFNPERPHSPDELVSVGNVRLLGDCVAKVFFHSGSKILRAVDATFM